ncbi:MAG: rhodanese-like domain-containing protein [Sulfurimonas sp.]|jgi:rhodanese-related sulfurtransferase
MKKRFINTLLAVTLSSTSALFAGSIETDKLVAEAVKEAGEIEPQKLKQMIDKEEALIVLDVRESEQRAEGQIYTDKNFAITRGNLEFEVLNKIKDKDAVIVTYCRGGSRGAFAAQTLKRLGYKNATNLKGGLKGWATLGYPIETGLGITKLMEEEK